jgi:hypothetical protein
MNSTSILSVPSSSNQLNEPQITHTVMMIRPKTFRMNEQTSVNNYFQHSSNSTADLVLIQAQQEFDNYVKVLRAHDIIVIEIDEEENSPNHDTATASDTADPNTDTDRDTPDALFPNNWITFHSNGEICLYPMYAKNRRRERFSTQKLFHWMKKSNRKITEITDLSSPAEEMNQFLEGTGSLLLDRSNRLAYCSLSPRAHLEMLQTFCEKFGYQPIPFSAFQTITNSQTGETQRVPIYHTNVLMTLGEEFVIICLGSIDHPSERQQLLELFQQTNKEIIEITEDQMHQFAGNMLELCSYHQGEDRKKFLFMSTTAYQSLTQEQIHQIEKYCELVHVPLSIIELCGGGSARCMLAEVFLPETGSEEGEE